MPRSNAMVETCNWCWKGVRSGSAILSIDYRIGQCGRDGTIEIHDETLLTLCAKCSSKLDRPILDATLSGHLLRKNPPDHD